MLKTFLKYMAVGTLNGLIYFATLFILTDWLGIWYMASAFVAVIIQTAVTFSLHYLWTWRSKKTAVKSVVTIYRLIKYLIVGGCGLVIGLGGLYLITEYFKVYYMISTIVCSYVLLVITFLINFYWTWGEGEAKELNWIVGILERLGFVPLIERLGVKV
jgi:dolichol-phosphate mannosyltransferase